MNWIFTDNTWKGKLVRTVIQGIIGVLVANIDLLIGYITIDPALKPVIAGAVMAILSPIMAIFGKNDPELKTGGTD